MASPAAGSPECQPFFSPGYNSPPPLVRHHVSHLHSRHRCQKWVAVGTLATRSPCRPSKADIRELCRVAFVGLEVLCRASCASLPFLVALGGNPFEHGRTVTPDKGWRQLRRCLSHAGGSDACRRRRGRKAGGRRMGAWGPAAGGRGLVASQHCARSVPGHQCHRERRLALRGDSDLLSV